MSTETLNNPVLNLSKEDTVNLASHIGGSKKFGPLTIEYNLDLSIPQVSGKVELYGVTIGQILINPENPTVKIGGNVGLGEAEVTLTANFDKHELDYEVDVKVFGKTLFDQSGKLFTW